MQMRKMKKLTRLLVMTLVMALLTGCAQNVGITLNDDGSGSMAYSMMIEQSAYKYLGSKFIAEFEKEMKKMGYKKTEKIIDNEKCVEFGKSVKYNSLKELKSLLTNSKTFGKEFLGNLEVDESDKFEIFDMTDLRLMRSAHITKYTFQGVFKGNLNRESEEMGVTSLLENFSTNISITFPREIQSTNGKKSADGKTVTWTMEESMTDTLLQATTSTKPVYPTDTKAPVIKGVKNGKYYAFGALVELHDNIGIKSATVNGKKMGSTEFFYNEAQYNITAKDFAGNTTKVTFYLDTTAPTVKGVKDEAHYNTSRKITFSDKNGISAAYLNDKRIKSGKVVSDPGAYELLVYDVAGNLKWIDFVIDKKKPTVTGVENGKVYTSSRIIRFKDNRRVKSATLNGKSIKSGKKVTKKGSYTLKVTDKAGNQTTVKFRIK